MFRAFEIHSVEFEEMLGRSPELKLVSSDFRFAEGVCWVDRGNCLIVSDLPNNRIMKWEEGGKLETLRQPSSTANGNTTDLEGRIISCLTRGRAVIRQEDNGSLRVVANRYRGSQLTSPNDVVVKSDGSIWFTDPDYGFLCLDFGHGDKPEQDRNRVYRVDPDTGEVTSVCEDFDKPNGLAFSPDEAVLYVGDSGRTHGEFRAHHVMAFDVTSTDSKLSNPRVFAVIEPWVPDGIKVDVQGNVFVTAGDGVQVFNSDGRLLGKIRTPETAGNCAFGMPDRQTLFIGASSCVWSVDLNTAGAVPNRPARPV